MGNWSLTGILLIIGLFIFISTFILTQLNIQNPYTGNESTIFSIFLGWIVP